MGGTKILDGVEREGSLAFPGWLAEAWLVKENLSHPASQRIFMHVEFTDARESPCMANYTESQIDYLC